ncbi:hypothetical protein H4218_006319 [Coemansia sp. IMI 209128]|nr:hypothetical protein H4218_006319 [Coemansia sp. IMI 209128]
MWRAGMSEAASKVAASDGIVVPSTGAEGIATPSAEGIATPSAEGIATPSAEDALAVAPSPEDNGIVTPSANDERAAALSADEEHIASPSTEGENTVAPSEGVANMGQFGVDICNTACGKYSGSLDTVGSSTSHALTPLVIPSAFGTSAAVSSQNDTASFVAGSSEHPASRGTGATGAPVSGLFPDQPSAQPTLGMDAGASTLSLSSSVFRVNGSQPQFGGRAPQSVDSSGSWPQPASTSTSDWPVRPLAAFISVTGGQVNAAAEGDIEIDAEGDIEVDAEDAMEERADFAMRETLAEIFAPVGTVSNFGTGVAHLGAASEQRLGTTQFGAAESFNSGVASRFALFGAPSGSSSGVGNGFGSSTAHFGGASSFGSSAATGFGEVAEQLGAAGNIDASAMQFDTVTSFGVGTVQSGATTNFGVGAGQFGAANSYDAGIVQSGDADGFGAGAAHLGTASEQSSDAAPLNTTSEESLGAALFTAASNAGSGAVNSALRGEPNNAEDSGWDTDGFMAGATYSLPANGSDSATRYSSDGEFGAGSGSSAATGAESNDAPAPAPSIGSSNSSAPATSISINDVVNGFTSLGLSGGTAASTALAQASAADSVLAVGTTTTVYVKESDGIHEYEETIEASGTVPVYRTTFPADPQQAEDSDNISEASDLASGLSLRD